MSDRFFTVVTTIQPPTDAMGELAAVLRDDATLVVVGDKRGPEAYLLPHATFLSFAQQRELPFRLAAVLPANHYARKNLGYLWAMAAGAECIYETDDDNAPLPTWRRRRRECVARSVLRPGWFNAYHAFGESDIWPRGFPLDEVRSVQKPPEFLMSAEIRRTAAVQQGLVNGSPDVDAVWRLVLDRPVTFDAAGSSIWLPQGSWCPFNSQSTWWWPEAFALMYLPSTVSFRMTDIWRGFVAQRCLWEINTGLVFHAPEVFQKRNAHNLMADFAAEQDGYLGNGELVTQLERLELTPGSDSVLGNLRRCYEMMTAAGFVERQEIELVDAWITDILTLFSSGKTH